MSRGPRVPLLVCCGCKPGRILPLYVRLRSFRTRLHAEAQLGPPHLLWGMLLLSPHRQRQENPEAVSPFAYQPDPLRKPSVPYNKGPKSAQSRAERIIFQRWQLLYPDWSRQPQLSLVLHYGKSRDSLKLEAFMKQNSTRHKQTGSHTAQVPALSSSFTKGHPCLECQPFTLSA